MLQPKHLSVLALLSLPLLAHADGPPGIDFSRDVLPIFKTHCIRCHDGAKKKASYRLDIRSHAFQGGESGKASIVPGSPGQSELFRRVLLKEGEAAMPPGEKKLSPEQIAILRRWIEGGATWPDALSGEVVRPAHWAFVAPQRPILPVVKDPSWVRNGIDHFILSRLEREGMKPSPEADRMTLARRLALDLMGLPPRIEDVDAFLKDARGYAYQAYVERLLASPHHGERWGRLWLDAARYADSDGFEKDKSRQVAFYRDWVVNALNRDLPYDQFIIEQIAGDLLPGATQDQIVATGFLRNSMINEEGGVDPEQFRMEAMFDRMDALGKGVLGLTIQCAQCHSHKYDPLSQVDYYRMFAFLNNCHEASVVAYTPDEQRRRADIHRRVKEIEDDLRHRLPDWPKRMERWEKRGIADPFHWQVVRPQLDTSGGQKHFLLADGSILAQGYAPTKHTTEFRVRVDLAAIRAVRLELLNDPNLPLGGPGRSTKGLFGLTEFRVTAAPADQPDKKQDIKIVRATADVNPPEALLEPIFEDKTKRRRVTGPIPYAIDGNDETAWGIDAGPGRRNVPRKAVFVFEQPVHFPQGIVLTFRLTQNHGGWNSDDNQNMNLGRFRFSVSSAFDAKADPIPTAVRTILTTPAEKRTPTQTEVLFSYWRTTVKEWKKQNETIERLFKDYPAGSSQLVLHERDQSRMTHLLKRGDFLKPADTVAPGVPGVLHAMSKDVRPDRLAFARWLVDRRSPTAARVIVNRVWQAYFGTGLISTPEDLGTQGELPSHPELLDWLAVEFMDQGWSLKTLHRLITDSATYRQSSRVTAEAQARDPYNRLLGRGARYRADAEVVRDIALAASGLLNPKVGGPSVFPPLPQFLMVPPASYGPKQWPESVGPERYRRALYTFRYRSVPYPALQNLDAPNGDASCVKRTRSNTPLQALTGLNETVFMECAQALALCTVRETHCSDEERLNMAFRRCVARSPIAAEREELLQLLRKSKAHYARPEASPWELAVQDPKNPPCLPAGVTPADLASWTVVARVLLNLDETVTRE